MFTLNEIGDFISWGGFYLYQDPYDYDEVWVTADDRHVVYKDLEDEHLANIISMLVRYDSLRYWPNLAEHWRSRVAKQCADFNLEEA